MRRLTRRQLLISLIFPVGITVWAAVKYGFTALSFGAAPAVPIQFGYLIIAVICGVVPVILTFSLGIDSGQYMFPRVIICGCAMVFDNLVYEYIPDAAGDANFFFLVVFNVFTALFFYKFHPTKFSEWVVIFLANPCLARLIEYFTGYLTVDLYL